MNLQSAISLEACLGDPWDAANPHGFDQILQADERWQSCDESVLDQLRLSTAFVPKDLGGQLVGLNPMISLLRGVFRRDPALGLGYGASSLLAAVNVWTAGSAQQQQQLAKWLLAGERVACGYHELAHGNDIGHAECRAQLAPDGIRVSGGKEVIANSARAQALLIFARTGDRGPRAHSLLLTRRDALARDQIINGPRIAASGMRGVALGTLQFNDCIFSHDTLLGTKGNGMETALRAFQVTRIALPGMFAGIVDTGLRLTMRHCLRRRLHGQTVSDIPLVQAQLAMTFADLLLCDAMLRVGANALSLYPQQGSVHAAAIKALVPRVLLVAMNRLANVLGAHSYLREGECAFFQKLLRDLQPVSFGHASRISCLMTMLPQLTALVHAPTLVDINPALFDLRQSSPLSFDALVLTSRGHDQITQALPKLARYASGIHAQVAEMAAAQVEQWQALRQRCAGLLPHQLGVQADPYSYQQAEDYCSLMAASASLGVWLQQQKQPSWLAKADWVLAALHRLRNPDLPLPECLGRQMFEQLMLRYHANTSFDLDNMPLAASTGWAVVD